jgi:predicted nucleic acid-binding Zn ribbon protein
MRRKPKPNPPPLPPGYSHHCAVCGNPVPGRTGKRGRPKAYCSAACREFFAAMGTLRKWFYPVAEKATPEAWLKWRGELWSMANAGLAAQRALAESSRPGSPPAPGTRRARAAEAEARRAKRTRR